jgi:hypothetical protein
VNASALATLTQQYREAHAVEAFDHTREAMR